MYESVSVAPKKVEATSGNEVQAEQELICPTGWQTEGRLSRFLSIPCIQLVDCSILGPDKRCCRGFCKQGIPAPPKKPTHRGVYFSFTSQSQPKFLFQEKGNLK